MSNDTQALCGICGEPMPEGEEMFNYHGHSGPCPKPPLTSRTGGSMKLRIISDDRDHAILVCDEDLNDIAEFFHADHATVDTTYETALMLARLLVDAAARSPQGSGRVMFLTVAAVMCLQIAPGPLHLDRDCAPEEMRVDEVITDTDRNPDMDSIQACTHRFADQPRGLESEVADLRVAKVADCARDVRAGSLRSTAPRRSAAREA